MNWISACGFLLWLMTCVSSFGEVRVIGVDGHSEMNLLPTAVFANQPHTINLEISGLAGKSGDLRADLFQEAGILVRPLQIGLHLADGLTFNTIPQSISISIKFPNVRELAKIRVHLYFAARASQSIGDFQVDVFPMSLTKELNESFKVTGSNPLPFIFGNGKQLRQFFSTQHVAFQDGGPNIPDHLNGKQLYFGDLTTREQFDNAMDHHEGMRTVLFFQDETLPEGIYVTGSDSGVLAHVNSTMLNNLSTDPREQSALLKVITLISPQSNSLPNPL